ncbi:hypothetical protein ACPOL_2640 [Acidisarcina polymorpha]|uniref:Uncharacterized protein n=1 Tax=Acidisarcina polymorpha TaxID=2211140 RepID=A0A2Z5FYH2_9BACT|nr:hypothetical protein ACPOL_2640 [Acidisarcina polymorpha]
MGQVTDLKLCHELGIRAVWIDRVREALNPEWTRTGFAGPPGRLSDLFRTDIFLAR